MGIKICDVCLSSFADSLADCPNCLRMPAEPPKPVGPLPGTPTVGVMLIHPADMLDGGETLEDLRRVFRPFGMVVVFYNGPTRLLKL